MSTGNGGILVNLETLEALPDPVLFVDTRTGPDYRRGHIPGAIHLDTFAYANERTDDDHWPRVISDWQAAFATAGISNSETVVFYDCGLENRAARNGFMLRYLGHPSSHILHGGAAAWVSAGRELTKEAVVLPPASPLIGQRRDDMVARVEEVATNVGTGKMILLDVRDSGEFEGRVRLQWNPRMGRIPGAVPLVWTELLESGETDRVAGSPYYRSHTLLRLRSPEEIRSILEEAGVDEDTEVILYCQKSHRACTAYLAFEQLGFGRVRVYPGSFREWSRRNDLPVSR